MFQKRRSMLGRRHLLVQQQAQSKPAQVIPTNGDGSSSSNRSNTSWRGGRSEKKKTPNHLNKASAEFKKRLFSQSPAVHYKALLNAQSQDRSLLSYENLNETGVKSLTPTPSSFNRSTAITPATAQQRRVEMQMSRYGPMPSAKRLVTKAVYESSKPTTSSKPQTSSTYEFDNLKPPDSPGPSRLERILLEEKLSQKASSYDYDDLKPPDSPGPSRLDRILLEEKLLQNPSSYDFNTLNPPDSPGPSRLDKLILEEKLEQPVDPDLKKIESLNLEDPNPRLQFSPPLSSTCIGSPDSGKKIAAAKEELKESMLGSGRKLSTIKEDCDVSVIEFELNERTICELDVTLKDSTMINTIKPNNAPCLNNISIRAPEESKHCWESMMSRLDNMERAVTNRAVTNANQMEILRQKIETIQKQTEAIQKQIENECQEDIINIRNMKKMLESVKHITTVARSTENKENNFAFKVPTCKKKQLDEESKWFNSVKKENPGLLSTPNPNRRINQSAILTPRSLSNVLFDQMNELYDK